MGLASSILELQVRTLPLLPLLALFYAPTPIDFAPVHFAPTFIATAPEQWSGR